MSPHDDTCTPLPALNLWLAISNAPSSRLVYRSNMSVCSVPSSGSQQGRTKATSARSSLPPHENAISIYPTPGSRMFPPTTWSAIAMFVGGEKRPVRTSSSTLSKLEAPRYSDTKALQSAHTFPNGPGFLPRYWDALCSPRYHDGKRYTRGKNAPWAMVPLKPKELRRLVDFNT